MTEQAPAGARHDTLDPDEGLGATDESDRGLGWLLTIGGAIGMLSAAILIIEKIHFIENPDQGLGCDINAFVSCGGVINTDQASAFGFPNPLIGVAAFAALMMIGVLLITRVRLPGLVWLGLQAGVLFGIGFVTWLQVQSIYEIQKLCPWCMVVWSVMIPIFVWTTARNLRTYLPGNPLSRFVSDWTPLITILWFVAVASAIWFKFGTNLWA